MCRGYFWFSTLQMSEEEAGRARKRLERAVIFSSDDSSNRIVIFSRKLFRITCFSPPLIDYSMCMYTVPDKNICLRRVFLRFYFFYLFIVHSVEYVISPRVRSSLASLSANRLPVRVYACTRQMFSKYLAEIFLQTCS